jgi:aspartokinase
MFFDKLADVLGIEAAESIISHASESFNDVTIVISNMIGYTKSLTFDLHSDDDKPEDPITLLVEMINECLQEFLSNPDKEEYNEEEDC